MRLLSKPVMLVSLLLSALYLPACKKDSALPKLPQDAVILAFGDSLTYGYGASPGHDYPSQLAELGGRTVVNAGVSGETSGEGLARLPGVLDEQEPQLLVLIHGGNDMIRKLPAQDTEQNLLQMLAEAKQRNIPAVLLGVPRPGLFLLESAEVYEKVAAAAGVPFDGETLPDILADNALKSDVIHPNDTGYRRLAEAIYALLEDEGAL